MRHIRELIALTETAHPSDRFFANVDETMRLIPGARAQYGAYERAFASLDRDSRQTLRAKAIAHFTDHRTGQRKQGFFNQLNDAFAYRHLVRQGYNDVRVLPEGTTTQPDIQYTASGELKFCEVKTIGISDELIARRATPKVVSSAIYHQLQTGFLSKLQSTLSAASRQIAAKNANGLVYTKVVVWVGEALSDEAVQSKLHGA